MVFFEDARFSAGAALAVSTEEAFAAWELPSPSSIFRGFFAARLGFAAVDVAR